MDKVALYRHRQIGWAMLMGALIPIFILLFTLKGAGGFGAQAQKTLAALGPVVYLALGVPLLVLLVFSSLEVSIDQEELKLRFGPGLVLKRFAIREISHAATTRTTFTQGWGIHRRGGVTLYNVSGFDAVKVEFRDGTAILVGSNEAARLAATLNRLVSVSR
jgi:hypothetical protein